MVGDFGKLRLAMRVELMTLFIVFFLFCTEAQPLDPSNDSAKNQIFQWPLDPVEFMTFSGNNDFATYNTRQSNYYHAGIDIKSGIFDPQAEVAVGNWTEYVTPVKSAADGEIVAIFSTPDTRYRCGGRELEYAKTYVSPSGSVNRGLGNAVILEHANGVYTLYGHMDCVAPEIHVGDRLERGTALGKMGNSTTVRRSNGVGLHLHFEVKDVIRANPTPDELLGNPVGGIYWGYTPDLPTGYGYHDPREFIHPFAPRRISPKVVSIVDGHNRTLNVRAGPGTDYAKLTRVKVGQKFVAQEEFVKGPEIWYRIHLPHATGETSGWIAAKHSDCWADTCAVEDGSALQVEIKRRSKVAVYPEAISPSLKVHDKIYGCYRDIHVWSKDRFVAESVRRGWTESTIYYRIYLPDPENPYNPSETGATGWLSEDCLSVVGED